MAPPVANMSRFYEMFVLAAILLATVVIYSPAMDGGKIWDDEVNLTRPELRSLDGLRRIWFEPAATAKDSQYYPLVHTAFWVEHKLWGDALLGYHLINIAWHFLAVLLVYLILKELHIPGALLAASIFAMHPVMVESVAWMTEQKNTLSTVFYLGAMFVYFRYQESRDRYKYLIAIALFACALLSKTATVTLPFAILVILWWQRGTLHWRRDVVPLVPFFALGLAAGIMTIWVETKLVGAEGIDFELTFVQRFLLAGRDIWFYLGKLVWPVNLMFIYPRWTIDPSVWWQWLYPIAAIATTAVLWAIRKQTRAPLASWLLFVGTLFPVLGFFNVYIFRFSFVVDHFQYLASLGIIALAAAGIARAISASASVLRYTIVTLCILALTTCSVISLQQSRMYADATTLFQTTLKRNPDCWMARNNLGADLLAKGDYMAAIEQFELSLRIKPNQAKAHNNLGGALNAAGRSPEAIAQFEAALAIRPDYYEAHYNLGTTLLKAGQLPQAIEKIRAALALKPDDPKMLNTLGVALVQAGQDTEAIEHLRHALEIAPDDRS